MLLIQYISEVTTISSLPEIVAHIQSMQVFMCLNVLNSAYFTINRSFGQINQGCNDAWYYLNVYGVLILTRKINKFHLSKILKAVRSITVRMDIFLLNRITIAGFPSTARFGDVPFRTLDNPV